MWKGDCGTLAVLDADRLVGVITDRDICIALGTRNRPASEVLVKDIVSVDPQTCTPDVDLHAAMATMQRAKVRRLPVVENGKLEGILALDDIVELVCREQRKLDNAEVIKTLEAVSAHSVHLHHGELASTGPDLSEIRKCHADYIDALLAWFEQDRKHRSQT
jgi:signal-transduction protein with cAMP-binding, CBS, and nucleotidyltransferase domain